MKKSKITKNIKISQKDKQKDCNRRRFRNYVDKKKKIQHGRYNLAKCINSAAYIISGMMFRSYTKQLFQTKICLFCYQFWLIFDNNSDVFLMFLISPRSWCLRYSNFSLFLEHAVYLDHKLCKIQLTSCKID